MDLGGARSLRTGRATLAKTCPRTASHLQGGSVWPYLRIEPEFGDIVRGRRWTGQRGSVMSSAQLYDTIGATYTVTRRTEPRIAARIWAALGDARTVLNVGAGTGSYEPPDRHLACGRRGAPPRARGR